MSITLLCSIHLQLNAVTTGLIILEIIVISASRLRRPFPTGHHTATTAVMEMMMMMMMMVIIRRRWRFVPRVRRSFRRTVARCVLLASAWNGVALRVVALPPDQFGQHPSARVDEPVAHLSNQLASLTLLIIHRLVNSIEINQSINQFNLNSFRNGIIIYWIIIN